MKPQTLLEKALAMPRLSYSPEQLDLLFAYAEGKISPPQFSGAMGTKRTNLHFTISSIIFEAIRRGHLVKKEGAK